MKNILVNVVLSFIGFTLGLFVFIILPENNPSNVSNQVLNQAQNLELRIESSIYGSNDTMVHYVVSGDIYIHVKYKDSIKVGDAITANNINFEFNDTTKWLSSKILNSGNWYSHQDHNVLCKHGALDLYKSDSIYYYKGDEIEYRSKIVH